MAYTLQKVFLMSLTNKAHGNKPEFCPILGPIQDKKSLKKYGNWLCHNLRTVANTSNTPGNQV